MVSLPHNIRALQRSALKRLLDKRKTTIVRLASLVGVPKETAYRWAGGRLALTMYWCVRIRRVLRLTADDFTDLCEHVATYEHARRMHADPKCGLAHPLDPPES